MDVIDRDRFTFESIKAWLIANDVPPKDTSAAPGALLYDGDARAIHWSRFIRDDDGRFTIANGEAATERMVTPLKDGQDPKYHLFVDLGNK